MSTDSEKLAHEFLTEAKYLWNSSNLNDTIVECGLQAVEEYFEDLQKEIDLRYAPDEVIRFIGFNLVSQTADMILKMYKQNLNNNF